ncbi:hypothetical protein GLOTRDRAFT_132359 [Gloeophyllum trabeum ATCC 11539]|uniref:Uncharacterized protein n=1 Tax=Gloeophyllum trabeum (strain ATCC 11539 / FP-39264 / Madison 617) TaxID=670483 RepID=S7PY15_GLOTA|nr:uncharacterized protein GLOTRDRAFT_132359 [Gloeophyllum trabeum ATCC 11539]EPQ52242.1 hypothetical protein GLOTRDRAFT_132359 [Gloeophyllum trabeum ATCC 11539]
MATSRDNSSPDHERSIHSPSPLREGRPNPRLSSPAPGPSAGPYGSGSQQRSVAEVVQEQFEPFDHRTTIVDPFEEENKREAEFREKLNKMLLDLTIEFHAWSTARPAFETNENLESLEKEINSIMTLESEQGMSLPSPLTFIEKTRQRLGDFVNRVKLALAALTGMGI